MEWNTCPIQKLVESEHFSDAVESVFNAILTAAAQLSLDAVDVILRLLWRHVKDGQKRVRTEQSYEVFPGVCSLAETFQLKQTTNIIEFTTSTK